MRGMIAVSVALLLGCSERGRETDPAENGGTVVVVTLEDPGTLFPPFMLTTAAKQIAEQIYDYLADVGPDLDTRDDKKFRRQLADSWRWASDSLSITFHINPLARWHDGRNVTARDVQFTYELNKAPTVASRYLSSLENIDSVTIADSLSATFWFHRPLPTRFLDAAAQMLILPAHQLERIPFDRLRHVAPPAPIGSGRFRLRRWDKGASLEIVADTANYRGRPKLDRVIWTRVADLNTAIARLSGGTADFFDAVRAENVKDLASRSSVRTIVLPGMSFGFLRFNLRDPNDKARPHALFGDRTLRRAITMSIDRNALVRSVFDTFAVVPAGPTVHAYPSTDPRLVQLPFDSARASRLLDSLGWVRGGNGVRVKNGRELAFTLIVSSEVLNRIRMSVLVQEQLRRMGVRMEVERMELSAQTTREERGDFDASIGAWNMPSSPDAIRDAWSSTGIGKNGVNYGSYSNARFDALLDSALTSDASHEREKFSAAYVVINEDAPAVWLYEPKRILGLHRRIRTARMRPDAWWFSLGDWYIPPAERVLRDRIGSAR